MKSTLMHRTDTIINCLRSVLSQRLPQTHSSRNIPTAKAAASSLQPTMSMLRDSTYSGNTGPVIVVAQAMFQMNKTR